MRTDGTSAEFANLCFDACAEFVKQDANDDVERLVVGVTSTLNLAWLDSGCRHSAVDRFATAVDQNRSHADGFHKDDVLECRPKRIGILHGAATQFDHCQPVAEVAYVAECLDEHFRFANRVVHKHRVCKGNSSMIM